MVCIIFVCGFFRHCPLMVIIVGLRSLPLPHFETVLLIFIHWSCSYGYDYEIVLNPWICSRRFRGTRSRLDRRKAPSKSAAVAFSHTVEWGIFLQRATQQSVVGFSVPVFQCRFSADWIPMNIDPKCFRWEVGLLVTWINASFPTKKNRFARQWPRMLWILTDISGFLQPEYPSRRVWSEKNGKPSVSMARTVASSSDPGDPPFGKERVFWEIMTF